MPSISVIITAHNRKEFLAKAIRSVLDQTLDRSLFEITVIKNFADEEVDDLIRKNNIIEIFTAKEKLGEKLILGIMESKGEIICFLEDDDIFFPDKLKKIQEVFNDKSIGYFHNSYLLIDQYGNELKGKLHVCSVRKRITIINRKLKMSDIRRAIRSNGFFNLSCISVRKDILERKLEYLTGLQVAVDNFMFYLSLDSGFDVIIDNAVLTRYRIHNLNSSISESLDPGDFIERKKVFFESDRKGFETIGAVVKNTVVKKYVDCRIIVPVYAAGMLTRNNEVKGISKVTCLRCIIKTLSPELIVLIVLNLISRIFRNFGSRFYFYYERAKIRHALRSKQ